MDDPCPLVRRVWLGQLAKGKEKSIGFLFWVMVPSFVILGLLVTFCVLVWTEQSGWRLRDSRGGPDFLFKIHPEIQINTENARSEKFKTGRTSTNTQQNIHRERHPKSKTREIQECPIKQSAGGRSGQMREGFFARWRQADDGAFQLVQSAHAGPIYVEAWRKEGKIHCPNPILACAQW